MPRLCKHAFIKVTNAYTILHVRCTHSIPAFPTNFKEPKLPQFFELCVTECRYFCHQAVRDSGLLPSLMSAYGAANLRDSGSLGPWRGGPKGLDSLDGQLLANWTRGVPAYDALHIEAMPDGGR